jgi:hypothetical protein
MQKLLQKQIFFFFQNLIFAENLVPVFPVDGLDSVDVGLQVGEPLQRFSPEVVSLRKVVKDNGQEPKGRAVQGTRGGSHQEVLVAQPGVDGLHVCQSKLVDFISEQNFVTFFLIC